jgi:hypothetical protein
MRKNFSMHQTFATAGNKLFDDGKSQSWFGEVFITRKLENLDKNEPNKLSN